MRSYSVNAEIIARVKYDKETHSRQRYSIMEAPVSALRDLVFQKSFKTRFNHTGDLKTL